MRSPMAWTYRLSLAIALAAILYLATTATAYPLIPALYDKLEHLTAFFVLALLVAAVPARGELYRLDESGERQPASWLLADGVTGLLSPESPLASETLHAITVAAGVEDRFGNGLAGNRPDGSFRAEFTTEDTTPPAAPPAGQVTATLPDDDVTVTITGTQGTVEPGALVSARNDSTGSITSVVAGVDGSFAVRVDAGTADTLALVLRDRAGPAGRQCSGLRGKLQHQARRSDTRFDPAVLPFHAGRALYLQFHLRRRWLPGRRSWRSAPHSGSLRSSSARRAKRPIISTTITNCPRSWMAWAARSTWVSVSGR